MKKRVRKRMLAILVVACIVVPVFLAGCQTQTPAESSAVESTAAATTEATATAESTASVEASSTEVSGDESEQVVAKEDYKIGITHYGLKNEFMVLISDAQKAEAEKCGVTIEVFDGNYDVNAQMGQVENMIAKGYDAIIISPTDIDAMSAAVDKAVEAGIPVIGVNTRVNSDKLTSYVGSNDVEAGNMEMTWMAETLGGEGNIVILQGPAGHPAQVERTEGINEILEQYPDIKVLAQKNTEWARSAGLDLMENWLQAFPDKIDGAVAENDELALGACQALVENGLKDEIPVIGVDAIADALTSMQDGVLNATLFQNAELQGIMSIDITVEYLNGEAIDDEYWIPFELVTPENVSDYVNKN